MSWPQVKEIIVLKCHRLLFYTATMNPLWIWLWRVLKSGLCTTTSEDQLQWLDLKEVPKHVLKPNLHQEKRIMVTVLCLIHYSFWILVKPLYLKSMLSKSMKCTANCKACSQHWSTERSQFFSKAKPDHMSHNQHSKTWTNWAMKFCLLHHINWPLANWLPPLKAPQQLFAGIMLPQPTEGRKCFPRVPRVLKHGFLCHRNE